MAGVKNPATSPSRRYCLISPCRDEARYIRRTLESVAAQTVLPALWLIVDDGSTDETPAILQEYQQRLPYLRVLRREDRGRRSVGPGVVDAFYAGYEAINSEDFQYITKLDVDLDLPPRYFERLMELMEADPRLGSVSGKPYFSTAGGRMVAEVCGDEMSVGMTKFYRRHCFEEIGGFVREVMWDGLDCHRSRMLGWKAASLDEPELRFEHLRPMGSSDRGILKGRMRHGFGQYFMGSSFPYVAASAAYRLAHPPRLLGSAAMLWGYLWACLTRQPRYQDPQFRRFIRKYQWRCLLQGKRRATAVADQQGQAVWRNPELGSV